MQAQVPVLSDMAQALCAVLILQIPLAAAGLALIHTGLGRSRSAAHAMMGSVCVAGAAVLTYFVCGWSWQGFDGGPAHAFTLAGKAWNWIGAGPFFLRGLRQDGSRAALTAWLGMFSVGVAALIPLGAGNDRWRLGASCASAALLAGWTYPLFAHWVWGGGWLAQLGANAGWGYGFLDAGGAGAIQTVGGLTALSIAWILGPRHGKYAADGMPSAIPGHNAVLVLFACFLTWLGWIGLNGSGSLLLGAGSAGSVASGGGEHNAFRGGRRTGGRGPDPHAFRQAGCFALRERLDRRPRGQQRCVCIRRSNFRGNHRGDCRSAGDPFGGVARYPAGSRRPGGIDFGARRRWPVGPAGSGNFCANSTRLQYSTEWAAGIRTSGWRNWPGW